jgi:hypothetical protein
MIPKSGCRFSEKIMLQQLEHDPEKWMPVFGKDHAPATSLGREGTMRIGAPKDFWAGVMFGGFAVVALLAARGYVLGSAGKMGPGYFPLLLGGLLGLLSAILIGRSLVLEGEPLPRFHVFPLAVIAAAVCLFGFFIEPLGLVVALAVLTMLSAWAGPQFRLPEALALTVALIVFSVGVFVYALGLSIPIWPSGWPSYLSSYLPSL